MQTAVYETALNRVMQENTYVQLFRPFTLNWNECIVTFHNKRYFYPINGVTTAGFNYCLRFKCLFFLDPVICYKHKGRFKDL